MPNQNKKKRLSFTSLVRVVFQRATGKATCVAEPKQEEEAKLDEPGNADELSFRAAVTQICLRKKFNIHRHTMGNRPPCAMAPLPLRGGAPTVLRNPLVTPGP